MIIIIINLPLCKLTKVHKFRKLEWATVNKLLEVLKPHNQVKKFSIFKILHYRTNKEMIILARKFLVVLKNKKVFLIMLLSKILWILKVVTLPMEKTLVLVCNQEINYFYESDVREINMITPSLALIFLFWNMMTIIDILLSILLFVCIF